VLLPYGVLLIPNWEKHDRQCYSSSEVVLARGGESEVSHHVNAGVGLATDEGPQPWLKSQRVSATVDWSVPVIAKTDDCIVQHSQKPRAVLPHIAQPTILGEVEVGVIIQLHPKDGHNKMSLTPYQ
jgi:hypothetical protein